MKRVLMLVLVVLAAGCTDAMWAKAGAFSQPHTVRLYAADGRVIQEWTSTGKVECSDGGICWFMDATTKKLVGTTGDIVVFVK